MALVIDAASGFKHIRSIIVHTGQHYDAGMSDVFFRDLRIPEPNYNLGVGSGSVVTQIAGMMSRLEKVLTKEAPDLIFVYGDTNSTLAGMLAAIRLNIPLAHVEAGLRSFNRAMPEETNRVMTDRVSDLLFCPTGTAVKNLRKEGVVKGVHLTGDVMLDMLAKYVPAARKSRVLKRLGLKRRGYYLATVHRAANTDDVKRLRSLLTIFGRLDKKVIFPVHPRTKKAMAKAGMVPSMNVVVIKPVPYIDMLALETNAAAILTDSGGVQKEAAFFCVPCVTLRGETEWVETVRSGWNVVAGVSEARIRRALARFTKHRPRTRTYAKTGGSAKKMLKIALRFLEAKG
ncbi:MAG: UDP-N-acetylglucosamine 2-epimerase (non-hydrolyzing) [Candidatus Omnitrophica bacterium]|nr:UDP-N-acetylglucosamine 2-epimerase (non-hydrolyzing) [Candidatus Omnitrophota bacterium]